MNEKPSAPKTTRVLVGDAMSTANFQALRAKIKAASTPSVGTDSDTWVTRNDSVSTGNFQTLSKAKPSASQSASTSSAVQTSAKTSPDRPPQR
jgi:hypothetical protein